MAQRPVLFVICRGALNTDIVSDAVDRIRAILVFIPIDRIQTIQLVSRQLIPRRQAPFHVLHRLPVAFL